MLTPNQDRGGGEAWVLFSMPSFTAGLLLPNSAREVPSIARLTGSMHLTWELFRSPSAGMRTPVGTDGLHLLHLHINDMVGV